MKKAHREVRMCFEGGMYGERCKQGVTCKCVSGGNTEGCSVARLAEV